MEKSLAGAPMYPNDSVNTGHSFEDVALLGINMGIRPVLTAGPSWTLTWPAYANTAIAK